jgi:LAO/AO transport system kinase
MTRDLQLLVDNLRAGNMRALSRVLSLIEDGGIDSTRCLELLYPHTGRASVIGITGAPGAGKSTLVDQLAAALVSKNKKVGILAVDPTSPFTGGALLGDRIRMNHSAAREGVFIRSMASRGALGGLAPRTAEAIFALDAAGYDSILVETVGVGQGEVEIIRTSDTVIVVLVPGMGDSVQALKAGILEIADIFTINKADYEGAARLRKELLSLLSLGEKSSWQPPIVQTVASEGKGIDELLAAVEEHRKWSDSSGAAVTRRSQLLQQTFERHLSEELLCRVKRHADEQHLLPQIQQALAARKQDPISAADALIADFLKSRDSSFSPSPPAPKKKRGKTKQQDSR